MQKDEILKIISDEYRKINKKYAKDPSYVLRMRVTNTAGDVLGKIEDIPFENLTTDLYFICNEVGFKYFSEKYRLVLEFAKLHPEKLPAQLYKYYRDIAKEIKTVSIAGYIRKLPEGKKALEEKVRLTQSLGLSLADNKTYVEPFIRQSWVLRIKDE